MKDTCHMYTSFQSCQLKIDALNGPDTGPLEGYQMCQVIKTRGFGSSLRVLQKEWILMFESETFPSTSPFLSIFESQDLHT